MSCSTRSTDRARRSRGFTLVEVIIAVAIFSIVIGVALSQLSESTDATRTVTAQSDLRRIGENVMNDIVRDLRSTLAPFTSVATTGDGIEFWRVTQLDFDSSGTGVGRPPLNGPSAFVWTVNTSSPVDGMPAPYPRIETSPANQAKPTFDQTLVRRYRQVGTDLVHEFGTPSALSGGTATSITLSKELVPANTTLSQGGTTTTVSGFTISSSNQTLPGLMSAGQDYRFLDKPTNLTITLRLRRLIGINKTTFDKEYAWVMLSNQIELRPTRKY